MNTWRLKLIFYLSIVYFLINKINLFSFIVNLINKLHNLTLSRVKIILGSSKNSNLTSHPFITLLYPFTINNASWKRKMHTISLSYEPDFKGENIPTKVKLIQMNKKYLDYYKKEIKDLLGNGLIRPSKFPWSFSSFYVNNTFELERGISRLVINFKPLNKAL